MPFGQRRVFKIVAGRVSHADFFHHPPRANVPRNRERDDLLHLQRPESEFQRRPRTFRRIAAVPVLGVEAPADLDAGGERRFEGRNGEADEASEATDAGDLDGPEPKPVSLKMRLDAVRQRVALFPRERARQELHDARIGVQGGKGRQRVELEAVPYKGSSEALIGVMRGDVDVGVETLSAASANIKAGKLRVLAVTSGKRTAFLPDTPGMEELRLPQAGFDGFYAVAAPAGTPAAVVQRLTREVSEIMALPEVKEKCAQLAMEAVAVGPDALRAMTHFELSD